MTGYVALLKGVNLGGRRKVPMAELRELLGQLGLTGVRTLLNSGNAVFSSPTTDPAELGERISAAIEAKLGLTVPCVVRGAAELTAVIDDDPLAGVATDGSRYMAHFLSAAPDPAALAAHHPKEIDPTVELGDRVVYQWCPDGLMQAPPVAAYVEKHLGVLVTARNWNTVTKLGAMLEELA